MTSFKRAYSDAVYLGAGSIATQTVILRFILSSPNGGEFYAALALGGWIAWVGLGALWGSKLEKSKRSRIWLALGISKLPIALLVFVYPSFFTGILDPVRFLPLAFLVMAVFGLPYGMMFAALISRDSKASRVYGNEAIGSVFGGLLTVIWTLADCADFGLLAIISALEISRCFQDKKGLAAAVGIIVAIPLGSHLDFIASRLRWPDFEIEKVSTGFSGRWSLLSRQGQTTITHNGRQIAANPDRITSEELLLWPLLYRPDPQNVLLIGYEGVLIDQYFPAGIERLSLYNDRAFARLDSSPDSNFAITDPLEFSSDKRFDIVYLNLNGCGTLLDYRKETVTFIGHLKQLISDRGVLYISAPSDENYISPYLADYLSSLYNTIKSNFDSVAVIPGARAGFVCFKNDQISSDINPASAIVKLKIDSPYFNAPLIINRLMPYRISNLLESVGSHTRINEIGKPTSVMSYTRWQNSIFGRSGVFFEIYRYPYLILLALPILPVIISSLRRIPYKAVFGISLFGFVGMAFEITLLYLFSTLFGTLYLHIGLLIAVFMAGLALGTIVIHRINYFSLSVIIIFSAAVLGILYGISVEILGLNIAFITLYMVSGLAGFAAGGGFGEFVNRCQDDHLAGATLYGADLYGALTAAVAVPGLLMIWGVTPVMIVIGIVGLIISATLFAR